jgi:Ala-tRNA(Pro) deacylase
MRSGEEPRTLNFVQGRDSRVAFTPVAEGRTVTSMQTTTLTEEIDRASIHYDVLQHRRTETASDEARAVGVRPEQVAKTIVLASDRRYIRAVLPASKRIDLHKVRRVLGDEKARLATECELALAYPMYELGAVPPFGAPAGDRILFDRGLTECESIVLEAGSHNASLRMRTADALSLAHAEIADIAAARID